MIKRKLFVAGMTAFAITTATGIAALASQGDVNRNAFGTVHRTSTLQVRTFQIKQTEFLIRE